MNKLFSFAKHQYSYNEFIALCEQLAENNQTTGEQQSEMYLHYSKLNLKRMQRLNKQIAIPEDYLEAIKNITESQFWWVITEAWCGDSAQNLPYIYKLTEQQPLIQLKIVLRDENPEIIDQYLTNGSKSIPKLIMQNKEQKDYAIWGPRPQSAQELYVNWKNNPDQKSFDDFELEMHQFYTKNKGIDLLEELKAIIK